LSWSAAAVLAATNTIYIFNLDFGTPPSTHIDPIINLGDTVTWVWTNGHHSTTAALGQLESWDSGAQSAGTATNFSHTFTNLGTYNYYCTVHGTNTGCRSVARMSGHVTVVLGDLSTPYQINGITQQGNDILVSWITGGICLTNILQRSTGAADGSFTTNFADIFTVNGAVGNTTNYLDVGAVTNFPSSYYRVRVPDP
jgi:plastocyanin